MTGVYIYGGSTIAASATTIGYFFDREPEIALAAVAEEFHGLGFLRSGYR